MFNPLQRAKKSSTPVQRQSKTNIKNRILGNLAFARWGNETCTMRWKTLPFVYRFLPEIFETLR